MTFDPGIDELVGLQTKPETELPRHAALATDIVCISSIDWDFMWQSHQEIMSRLASRGARVLFIENTGVRAPRLGDLPRIRQRWRNWRRGVYGIRQEREHLFVFSPLVIPLPHSPLAAWLNRRLLLFVVGRWIKAMGFTQPIIWTFLPTRLTLDLIDHLDHRLLIYYCVDRFSATSAGAQKIHRTEVQLLKQADVVFVTSQALAEHCGQAASNVHVFPVGVDLRIFDPQALSSMPPEMAGLPRPIVGYIGGLHQWCDLPLLRTVALEHPDYSIVLIGPVQTTIDALEGLPNVTLIDQRPHEQLPDYIRAFDVGIIPYRVTEYTRHVFPSKLNEYLALGKPVVSTALPEIEAFAKRFGPVVHIAHDADAFNRSLEQAISGSQDGLAQARRQAAQANDWDVRLEEMSVLIDQALERKWDGRQRQWRQIFVDLARVSRQRVLKIVWMVAASYTLVFHTPMVWWMAQPLKIAQSPRQADAIVVFAGGVGESGQAGQGYEERVSYAVSLYQQRYAPRLVFSSGFHYALQEADVMKALAVSMGVPPQAITLERSAANTHENVRNSAALLRRDGLHSALVISSPYHMRRAALVWRKEASDLIGTWTPIPYSHFFGDQHRLTLRQLVAIMHEYVGIAAYWWKGWI